LADLILGVSGWLGINYDIHSGASGFWQKSWFSQEDDISGANRLIDFLKV
jgi:hypothetical protein